MPVILNQPINTNLQEGLILDQNDKNVLYCMGAYILIILILWDLPFLKSLLYPFKLVVTVFHEMGHATMCKLTGGKVVSIQIDADTGGVTEMIGGNQYVTLPAGYLGTAIMGGLMVFCSFGFLPSQVCSVIIAIVLLFTLYWGKNSIARFIAILYVCLIPLLWWYSVTYPDPVNPGLPLRLFVLFMGVMNSLQTLFDFKFLTLKVHPESDASKFAKITCGPPQMWGFIWTLLGIGIMGGFTLLGIIMFKTVQ